MNKKLFSFVIAAAAIMTLAVYSSISHVRLENYRLIAKYSSQRAFEETAASVDALSAALEKGAEVTRIAPSPTGFMHMGGVRTAEAVIRRALFHQLLGVGQIQGLAFALHIRAVIAADIGAFVPVKSADSQGIIYLFNCAKTSLPTSSPSPTSS